VTRVITPALLVTRVITPGVITPGLVTAGLIKLRLIELRLIELRLIEHGIGGTHRLVAGPPKRFAQAMGLTFSAGALVAWLTGWHVIAIVLIAGLLVAASLEAFAGVCLGCIVFNRLIRWGLVPASVCVECADISDRLTAARASAASS
jgi:hypothetical protein